MKKLFVLLLLLCKTIFATAQQTVGLFTQTPASQNGYVLFAPMSSSKTYLIDKCGREVHEWSSTHKPGLAVYLLQDGSLLRTGNAGNTTFNAGGQGGVIERSDWNSTLQLSFTISDASQCQHHDVCQLPNGNVLAIVWELKTTADATAAGRNPAYLGTALWSEKIVELQPSGTTGASVVWEWHVWDHLVQDYSSAKPAFGVVADHPELINLNYYLGMPTASDWLHINSVAYNPALDQIMLSVHNFSEFWVIDHGTTTTQAAAHSGGTHNRGGDLLYRWGNPAAYARGTASDRVFYTQHNAHWIESGLPGAGKVIIFNNGTGRPGGNYSSVDVMTPPMDANGNYTLNGSFEFAPASPEWQYKAANPTDFYANNIGGAQRLSNGNTLICNGPSGEFFETDSSRNIVWRYVNPVGAAGPISQGTAPTMNSSFRCTLYEPSYAGLAGKSLVAGVPIELNPLASSCSTNTTGISQPATSLAFSVENPFSNELLIHSPAQVEDAVLTLAGIDGRLHAQWHHVRLHAAVNFIALTQMLPAGTYMLRIITAQSSYAIKLQK